MTTLVHSLSRVKTISLALPEVDWKKFYFVGILLISAFVFLSLLFYVFGINDLTEGSYLVKKYHKEIANLSIENAKLETASAEIGFLGSIQARATELSFQKVKNVNYIQITDFELAHVK